MGNRCDCCGDTSIGPMLREDIWQQLANGDERNLCFGCMFERAELRLGRTLIFADLLPCAFNLFHRPHSWFDIMLAENGPPSNLDEWRSAARELGMDLHVSDREEINAAKVAAMVDVLKDELPKLVAVAFAAFKADEFAVRTIAAGLSDAEWKRVKRDENQRRKAAKP